MTIPPARVHPALPPSQRSALGAFARQPVFWAALGLALFVHLGFLFSAVWWHLPWQQPAPRMALLLRTIVPPTLVPPAPAAPAPVQTPAVDPATQAAAAQPVPQPASEQSRKSAIAPAPKDEPTPAATAVPIVPKQAAAQAQAPATSSLVLQMEAPPSTEFDFALSLRNPQDPSKNASGRAVLQWQNLGSSYAAQLQLQAAGTTLREWQSTGSLVDSGLRPTRFSEKRAGSSEQAVHFNYAKSAIIFSNNQATQALPAGVQDPLSSILQLGALIGAQAEAQPAVASFQLAVANVRGLEMWQMSARDETLTLDTGAPRASIKIERAPLAEYDLRWEIWYDSESFLPLRIQTTNAQGATVSMTLENSILKTAP